MPRFTWRASFFLYIQCIKTSCHKEMVHCVDYIYAEINLKYKQESFL